MRFPTFKNPFREKSSLEKQIEVLGECGLHLRPGITVDHLLISQDRQEYEAKPFEALIWAFGIDVEEEPYERMSNDVWFFDTECIEDHGAYTAIAQRLSDMAGASLPLKNISDFVDVEEGRAELWFQLDGKDYHWHPRVQDDWTDMDVFNGFAELLEKREQNRRFAMWAKDCGQAFLLTCLDPGQIKQLKDKTDLVFLPMSGAITSGNESAEIRLANPGSFR